MPQTMQVEGKMLNYDDNMVGGAAGQCSGKWKACCDGALLLAPYLHASMLDACCLFMIAFSEPPRFPSSQITQPITDGIMCASRSRRGTKNRLNIN